MKKFLRTNDIKRASLNWSILTDGITVLHEYGRCGGKGIIILAGRYATIMQAEVIGILDAAQLAMQERSRCIYARTADERAVELLWTTGHRGMRCNEIANDLVRLGAGRPVVCPC